jgi:hypothetical protein
MKRMFVAALACVILAGCAMTRAPISPVGGASVAPLAREKIAVSYQLVDKRISYSEVLFRPLWLDERASAQDFSGIWQADRDLTDHAVERMREQGFLADSVYAVASPSAIEANNRQTAALARRGLPSSPKGKKILIRTPPVVFFEETPSSAAFKNLAGQLRSKGYSYLAELTSMHLAASAPGYGLVIVAAAPNLRFIDLQTGRVIWTSNLSYGEASQLGGDFRKLEENNMQGLKNALRAGMAKVDFVGLLGVKPYASDW